MGTDTTLERRCDEAAREVAAARHRLTEKADHLQERLKPKAVLRPLGRRLRDTVGAGGEKLLDAFRDHPVPLALTGIGLGWLMWSDLRGRRPEAGGEAPGKAREAVRKVKETARKTSDWFSETLEENPIMLALGALAAGLAAGLAFPATERETSMAEKLAGAEPEPIVVPSEGPGQAREPEPGPAGGEDDPERELPPEL